VKRPDVMIHGIIALAWVSCALGISLKVALLGNEAAAAGKQRGADFKVRSELAYKQERLRAVYEQEASVPAVEQLVQTLGLPLVRPSEPSLFRSLELPMPSPVLTAAVGRFP
jgi:hypothetical protein